MTAMRHILGHGQRIRRDVLLRYLIALTAMSLVWEFAQMPLYTLGQTGTAGEIIYSALHCAAGDAIIGGLSLLVSLVAFGKAGWPRERRVPVLIAAVITGLIYTVFSEWLNVEIRGAWAYSERMLLVPVIGTGVTPLLQWAILPVLAYLVATSAGRTDGTMKPSVL